MPYGDKGRFLATLLVLIFIQYLVGLMTPPYPLQTSHVKLVITILILK